MLLNLIYFTERMMNGLEHIRNMIGDAEASKLSDEDIAEALYHFYFDVEQATTGRRGISAGSLVRDGCRQRAGKWRIALCPV